MATYKDKVRRVKAKAFHYSDGALANTFTENNKIKSIEIQRIGEDSKFFGFGVSHRLNIKLIDINRELNFTTSDCFSVSIGLEEYTQFPNMYITEVNRDENTNELSITAYDILDKSKKHMFNELTLTLPYTISDVVNSIGSFLGISVNIPELDVFNTNYPNGANLEGTESFYDVLTSVSEATQTIFYINGSNTLVFKRLDKNGNAVLNISKEDYITFDSGNNRRLQTICHATELGDNVSASTTQIGTTQYVRDNPFWDLREDIDTLVNNALSAVGNMTINQFSCEWRGNPLLQIGDKISLTTKDNQTVISYLLNDTLTFDGGLSQKSEWNYEDSEETESNPSDLGELLRQTFARVDKANKKVDVLVSEVDTNKSNISNLQLTTDSISASVESLETTTNSQVDTINNLVLTTNNLTNTIENRGGNNLLRNSYFYEYENGLLTYWNGPQNVVPKYESKSRNALSLQNGTLSQTINLTNKKYCFSFKFIKLTDVANAKVLVNNNEIVLNSNIDLENYKEYIIDLKSDSITIDFVCDTNDGFLIYEPMLNEGDTASVFTQNYSESISDTVNIGKGIEVLASNIKNKTRMDADGLRGINTETNELTFYQTTDGIYGKEVETESIRSGNLIVTTRNGHNFMSGL